MTTLSVIVPAYNESATILEILGRVRAASTPGVTCQVVVIDDGSTDGTGELLESRPDLYDALIRQPNGGKGAAVKAGLARATGDFVLFQDADLEYDPAEYAKLLYPVLTFDADVVVGSRLLAPPFVRIHYFWHLMGNRVITLLFNMSFNTTFTDIYSCYLLYRRSLIDPARLKTEGWEQHAEILCEAVRHASHIYEVPISYAGRGYDAGKKIRAWHVIGVVAMILGKAFRLR
jgi:glycosyltransferase involved in cell wall biosynthesis